MIRVIGRVRQGSQRASPETRSRPDGAMNMLKITAPVTDWAAAWNAVLRQAAAAVYAITVAARRHTPPEQ
jgi:hypothetical protein